jgi:hypothetical protein
VTTPVPALSPVLGLVEALRKVRDCTARADTGGCEDCQDTAVAALAAFEQRPRLRDDEALVRLLDEFVENTMLSNKSLVADRDAFLDEIEQALFPREPGTGGGSE